MVNRREDENLNDITGTTGTTTGSNLRDDKMIGRTRDEQAAIPVVEEELAVGKRTVETGGVRVEKEVTARPVEENVSLHEERVTVERRPVNREVQPGDLRAFENETIEMRETAEEAVVEKRARVVEEVVVGKEAHERTEHISDTVRRTDVRIEPIAGSTTASAGTRTFDDAPFRTHYSQNFANSGWEYDNGYSHAYRYGYDLAGSSAGSDWSAVEPEVQAKWETRNKGTWERFKDAIRYGFDQGRQ
jgi:uncharacterized protein (TIGR02271 family)